MTHDTSSASASQEQAMTLTSAHHQTATDANSPKARALRQMQWVALGCLCAALGGLGLSHLMGGQGGWAWLRAGCEAAAVGALADWFAVVALFRRPLGLPIWHTAIVPRNKARIADSLAEFVRDHFLSPDMLLQKLKAFDPAARLSDWLRQPQQVSRLVDTARDLVLDSLDTLDDQRIQQAIVAQVQQITQHWDASTTLAQALDLLTHDGRHQQLLNQGLALASDWAARDEVKRTVGELIHKHVQKALPNAMTWASKVFDTESMAQTLAQQLSESALEELGQVLRRADHPLRKRYEQELILFLHGLRHDADLRQRIDQLKIRTLTDPTFTAYLAGLWADVKQRIRTDLNRRDSSLAGTLHSALSKLGRRLADSPELRQTINQHVMVTATHLAQHLQGGVTSHIANTIKAWDDRQLVRQMELNVGRDLQFIRINGTVVGGLAGLLLYGAHLFVAAWSQ